MANYSVGQKYIILAFSADNLFGKRSIVDAYYGDKKLLSLVPNLNSYTLKKKLSDLIKEVDDTVEDTPPYFKKTFLKKQLNALITQIDIFSKEIKTNYKETIKILLDINPTEPDRDKIDILKKQINELLLTKGYKGSLKNMVSDWKKEGLVSSENYIEEVKNYQNLIQKKPLN